MCAGRSLQFLHTAFSTFIVDASAPHTDAEHKIAINAFLGVLEEEKALDVSPYERQ